MRACRLLAFLAIAIPLSASADMDKLFPSLVQQAQTQLLPVVTINGGAQPGTFVGDNPIVGVFDSTSTLDNLTSQISSQFQRFPVGSTVAAFTFQFDPELNVFTRSTEGLGPLQSDRAQTIGKGKVNVSFAYSRVHFTVFEGEDLDELDLGFSGVIQGASGPDPNFTFDNGAIGFSLDVPVASGQSIPFIDSTNDGTIAGTGLSGFYAAPFVNGSLDVVSVRSILDAQLDVDVFAFFLNYGITDWLDIGAVVPLMNVEGSGQVTTIGLYDPNTGVPIPAQTNTEHDSSFGFGDIILRAKARALTTEWVDIAGRFDLTLPTGNKNDFRGYGNPAFGPTIILSKTFGIVSPHANAGLNFRTDDPDQDSFRWAVGLDVQPVELLTLTADVIGENLLHQSQDIGENIYGISGGLKVNPWRRLVLSGNALVRLNSEGLRADVIPSVAIEYTFF